MQTFRALPPDPHWPLAAGGCAPDPQNSPPLRISGYAPDFDKSKINQRL